MISCVYHSVGVTKAVSYVPLQWMPRRMLICFFLSAVFLPNVQNSSNFFFLNLGFPFHLKRHIFLFHFRFCNLDFPPMLNFIPCLLTYLFVFLFLSFSLCLFPCLFVYFFFSFLSFPLFSNFTSLHSQSIHDPFVTIETPPPPSPILSVSVIDSLGQTDTHSRYASTRAGEQ